MSWPFGCHMRHFIDPRKTVVIRRTQFDLKKAEERAHLLTVGAALAAARGRGQAPPLRQFLTCHLSLVTVTSGPPPTTCDLSQC